VFICTFFSVRFSLYVFLCTCFSVLFNI
jgi:hypothetical protein